jgi:hypothetical protein
MSRDLLHAAFWSTPEAEVWLRLSPYEGPSPHQVWVSTSPPDPLIVEVPRCQEPLLASNTLVRAGHSTVHASTAKLPLQLWRLYIPLPYRGQATLTRIWDAPLNLTLIQELPLNYTHRQALGAGSSWANAAQAELTADRTEVLDRGQLSWIREEQFLSVFPIPAGERYLRRGVAYALQRAVPLRGQLPSPQVTLWELGLWLWALTLKGEEALAEAALRELTHYRRSSNGNLPGLSDPLYTDGRSQAPSRNTYAMAWLGYHLVQTLGELRGRARTHQIPDDHRLLEELQLLLLDLGWCVANAVSPHNGWAARGYDAEGYLDDQTDYTATIMACLFLEALCSLEYRAEFHERAAVAWLAIWGAAVPESDARALVHRLWWEARYQQGQQVDRRVTQLLAILDPNSPEAPLLPLALEELDYDAPPGRRWSELTVSTASHLTAKLWGYLATCTRPARWLTARRYELHALPAYQYAVEQFQRSRWMLPYGYRWFSLQAEHPREGRLGAFLYACTWGHFYWYLHYANFALAPHVLSNQSPGLTTRGLALYQPRRPLEPDDYYRRRCSLALRRSTQTTAALTGWTRSQYGTALLILETAQVRFPQRFWLRWGRLLPDPQTRFCTWFLDCSWNVIQADHTLLHRLPQQTLPSPQPSLLASTHSVDVSCAEQRWTWHWNFGESLALTLTFDGGSYYPYTYLFRPFVGTPADYTEFVEGGPILPLRCDQLEITADRTCLPDYRSHPCRPRFNADAREHTTWSWHLTFAENKPPQLGSLHLTWSWSTAWNWQLFYSGADSSSAWNWYLNWQSCEEKQDAGSCRFQPLDASTTLLDLRYGRPGHSLPLTADSDFTTDCYFTADQATHFVEWVNAGPQLILYPYEDYPELVAELPRLAAAGVQVEVRPLISAPL